MKKEKRYCCKKCGSQDIEVRALVKPNENNKFSTYFESSLTDTEPALCCKCGWTTLEEKEVEVEANALWRCRNCGSLAVQQRAWVNVNTNDIDSLIDGGRGDYYCETCEQHNYLVLESELMGTIADWWGQTEFKAMERITGYRQIDFSPEEGFQAFVDACHEWWNGKTNDEKISVYFENK